MSITNNTTISAFGRESISLLRLSIPIFIGQFCTQALGLIDSIMAAKVSDVDLAAISLGSTYWGPLLLFSLGITFALAPITAQLKGSGEPHRIPGMTFNAIYPVLISTAVVILIITTTPRYLLSLTGSDPALIAKTCSYLNYVAFGLPAIALYNVLKNTVEGLSITTPAMVIAIVAVFLNIPLNYILIYGKFGLPAMGAVGCGLATAVVGWFLFFSMLAYCRFGAKVKNFHLLQKWQAFNLKATKQLCRVGLPISGALVLETFSFCIIGYLITNFGSKAVAAHQIAYVLCVLVFMIPASFSNAISIRIGLSLGENSIPRVMRSVKTGLTLAVGTVLTSAVIVYSCRYDIISVFSLDPEITKLALPLFICLFVYQLQDGFFGTSQGILRGFRDTKILMLINLIVLWPLVMPLGCVIAFTDFFGAKAGMYGLWGTLVGGYYLITLLMWLRSFWLLKHASRYTGKLQ